MMITRKGTARAFLIDLSRRCGHEQPDEGKRTLYGNLASITLANDGLNSGVRMGMWMHLLCDDLGIRPAKGVGIITVARRLEKWLAKEIS